jgi:hypothetical protein
VVVKNGSIKKFVWSPLRPELVVEVGQDHFAAERWRFFRLVEAVHVGGVTSKEAVVTLAAHSDICLRMMRRTEVGVATT